MPNATPEAAPFSRKVELHLAAARSPDAFAVWHSALADMFDVALGGDKPAPFRGDVVGFNLGDCLTFNNASVGQHLTRTPALARRSGLDHVMIQYQTSGHLRGDYGGSAVELRPGDVGFLDFAGSTASSETDFSRITLIVPRERLPRSLSGRDFHGVVLDRNETSTRVLARYMTALWQSASSLTEPQAATAVDAALELANVWSQHGVATEQLDGAAVTLRHMADAYIDTQLADPGLTPGAVAAALQLSRTSLYRLFEADGGVRAHILSRRLDHCLVAIVRDAAPQRPIGSIAFTLGFNSEAHFSRAFRHRFGISARDLRGSVQEAGATGGESHPGATDTLHDWMRGLGLDKFAAG
jgi:AraC-like DNA-binding protein